MAFPLQLLRLLFVCFLLLLFYFLLLLLLLLLSSSLSFRVIAFVCFCSLLLPPYNTPYQATHQPTLPTYCLPHSLLADSCLFSFLYFEHGAFTQKQKRSKEHGHAVARMLRPASCVPPCVPPCVRDLGSGTLTPFTLRQSSTLVKGKNLLCLIIIFLLTIRDAYAKKDNRSTVCVCVCECACLYVCVSLRILAVTHT